MEENVTDWLTNISNILSVLSAAGLLGGGVWMYRRENRRIKQAEAAKAEKLRTFETYLPNTSGKWMNC